MTGVDSFGHPLVIGSWPEKEPQWAGLKPSDLLLLAAASCSMYDVVLILTKQKEPLVGLEIECSGQQEAEPPYQFTHIHLHYRLKGPVNPKKAERAIQLSEEKYCSVLNTLKHGVELSSDFEIVA
jgi:putative redox protein